MAKIYGEEIRNAREAMKLMPAEVAGYMQIELDDYRLLEAGEYKVSKEFMKSLATILGIELEDIYDESFKETKTLCIYNEKGGVGKSTITDTLAVALSLKGKTVLIVDLDSSVNATAGIGSSAGIDDEHHNIYGLLTDPRQFKAQAEEYIVPTRYANIDIICGSRRLKDYTVAFESMPSSEFFFLKTFRNIFESGIYDFILIDNSGSENTYLKSALYCSDYAIAPIDVTMSFSIMGIDGVFDTLAKYLANNDKLCGLSLLLNKYDKRIKDMDEIINKIRKDNENRGDVFETIIRTDIQLEQAIKAGQSLYEYNPKNNRAADDFLNLANEIITKFID